MFNSLQGRSAIVTGGSKGIGRGIAETFARAGVNVVITGRTQADIDGTVAGLAGLPGTVTGVAADVTSPEDCRRVVATATERNGGLDIVCANAGIAPTAFRETSVEEDLQMWTDAVDVNLVGSFHTAKAAIPHLIAGERGGSIVFTSSTAGLKGFGGMQGGGLGYAASKHGIVGLMRTLANALAPHSIRVNTVHPTAVNTMMAVNPAMTAFLENYPDGGPHLQNPMPVAMLEPGDISAAIAYLVSDAAKYVTGVTFPVDAGFCNKL